LPTAFALSQCPHPPGTARPSISETVASKVQHPIFEKKRTHTDTESLNGPPIKKWNDDASYLDHPLLLLGNPDLHQVRSALSPMSLSPIEYL
jgi:hypothetical protein